MTSWLCCAAVAAAVLTIRYGHVMHPGWQWIGITFPLTFIASIYGLVTLLRSARQRPWLTTMRWFVALVLPPLICFEPVAYGWFAMSAMRQPIAQRRLPLLRAGQQFSAAMGAPLLDAAARIRFPRRTAGKHVVMLYKSSADPKADVAAMDEHIERMSALLGRDCTDTVHWVRGSMFGVSRMYFQGMSFGSDSRERDGNPTELDYHEVAHFVIEHLAGPYSRPPSMLQEGWAQAQTGRERGILANRALKAWAENPRLGPAGLAGRDYYDSREYIVYLQGGAFADFLLRRYGGPKFFELYRTCREASFAQDCERVLGVSLAEIEKLYSDDLEQEALRTPDRKGLAKAPLRLLSASGRPSAVFIWIDQKALDKSKPTADIAAREAFLAEYPAALARLRQAYDQVSIEATTRYRRSLYGQETRQGEVSEQFAQDGPRWRGRTIGDAPEQIFIFTPDDSVVLTATNAAGHYKTSKQPAGGISFQAEYGGHSRMLPYRLGHRDVSEVLSDESFVIRDLVAVQFDGQDAVEVRFERLSGREHGHITFDPNRSWAVLEYSKTEQFEKSPERTETYRFSYDGSHVDRPVVARLRHTRATEETGRHFEEDTDVTKVSFERPNEDVFRTQGQNLHLTPSPPRPARE
jgi:hypothetical protein